MRVTGIGAWPLTIWVDAVQSELGDGCHLAIPSLTYTVQMSSRATIASGMSSGRSPVTTTTSTQRQPVLGLPDPGERVPRLAWPTVALYVGTLALFAVNAYGFLVGGLAAAAPSRSARR